MITIITGFGILMVIAGLVIMAHPQWVFDPLRRWVEKPGLQGTAIMARLMLGVLLVSQADLSRHPAIILVLGWLSIAAAIILVAIGRTRFRNLMLWAFGIADRFGRAAGFVAALFGTFLVYAFI